MMYVARFVVETSFELHYLFKSMFIVQIFNITEIGYGELIGRSPIMELTTSRRPGWLAACADI